MHKFVFTLEPLLKVKKVKKKKLEKDMAKEKQRLEEERAILRQMTSEKEELQGQINKLSGEGTVASKLKEYSSYFQFLCDRIDIQTDICRQIEEVYERIKAELVDMLKEIDMLERLKEEQFREYLYEMDKEQEKSIEELVNFNFTTRGESMHG